MLHKYLESGGSYRDLGLPHKYLKKLIDGETYKLFNSEYEKRKCKGQTQDLDLLIQVLHTIVLHRQMSRVQRIGSMIVYLVQELWAPWVRT